MTASANFTLKEEIRAYWSERSATFDDNFGHRILPGPEHDAFAAAIRSHLGARPLRVLEVASGTGELTKVLLSLGHDVTGLDFSEAMVRRSRDKHRGEARARFHLADAENTLMPDAAFDAVVCRHLVWTLTDPVIALRDWARVLAPGGHLLVFDGDFVNLPLRGRLVRRAISAIERIVGPSRKRDPAIVAQHAAILGRLPFSGGLTFDVLRTLAEEVGFTDVRRSSYGRIAKAQRAVAGPVDWLGTFLFDRFILSARRRQAASRMAGAASAGSTSRR